MREKLSGGQLLELYRIAVEEYRFEVKLNWDRTVYYVVFNSALISAATGILKTGNGSIIYLITASIYLSGAFACMIGRVAIQKGHEYYRRTVVKKTLIEDLLGLAVPVEGYPAGHDLTVGTTAGQSERWKHLYGTNDWLQRDIRNGSITSLTRYFLLLLFVVNIVGLLGAGYLAYIGAPGISHLTVPSHLPSSAPKPPAHK